MFLSDDLCNIALKSEAAVFHTELDAALTGNTSSSWRMVKSWFNEGFLPEKQMQRCF
jgi:hypothetical protein